MIADYHVHTPLCGHASGEARQYVERAVGLGMREMGFADHLPMVRSWKPGFSMLREELDAYVAMVRSLAAEYASDIRILLGIEVDFFEGAEKELADLLAGQPFDYAIGSVHELSDGFIFDVDESRDEIPEYGVDRIYLAYYRLVAQAAGSGLFRVVGHLDLPKKYGHRPQDAARVGAAASAALAAIRAAGAVLEINTAGWTHPVEEAYPAPDLLAEAHALGIPLTMGSDAHRPDGVGACFPRALELARAAGYQTVVRLSDGGGEGFS